MRLSLLHKQEGAHEDSVWTAAWVPNSNQLLTGSVDETVVSWSEVDDALQKQYTYPSQTLGVVSVTADASGTYAASSSLDSSIRVWNVQDHTSKALIETPPSETWAVAFHPAQDRLLIAAAGGRSYKVVLWDAEARKAQASLKLPSKGEDTKAKDAFALSVAVSPDGRRVACGAMDGSVAVFDLEANALLHTLEGHSKPVRGLTFTPDSRMLLTACDDMHAHLYDVEHAALVDAFSGHESWVLCVGVHPDGSAFASGSSDSKVKLWDLHTRTCAQTLAEHSDQVWGVAFRPDGSRLVSVSDDKSVALYDFA